MKEQTYKHLTYKQVNLKNIRVCKHIIIQAYKLRYQNLRVALVVKRIMVSRTCG